MNGKDIHEARTTLSNLWCGSQSSPYGLQEWDGHSLPILRWVCPDVQDGRTVPRGLYSRPASCTSNGPHYQRAEGTTRCLGCPPQRMSPISQACPPSGVSSLRCPLATSLPMGGSRWQPVCQRYPAATEVNASETRLTTPRGIQRGTDRRHVTLIEESVEDEMTASEDEIYQ